MTNDETLATVNRHGAELGRWLLKHYPDPSTWNQRWVAEQANARGALCLAEIGDELDPSEAFAWGMVFQTAVLLAFGGKVL
jgi:hypothetical protein